ncbi:MAG: SpoIIE family protein phosphatase [Desulfobacterales bacterium]|jgi:sigma-B regulation protein RsbU (phosphoserine phosphatase)
MKLRWKFFIILFIFSLIPLLSVTVISQRGTRRLGRVISADLRQNLTSLTSEALLQAVENSSKTLLQTMNNIESSLLVLAYEAEQALREDPPERPQVYYAYDFDDPDLAPLNLTPYRRYLKKSKKTGRPPILVSFDHPVFLLAPGVSKLSVNGGIARLTRVVPALKNISGKLGRMVFWTYVSTESGIHLSYPGHGGYPEGYDPRKRPWYRDAASDVHWTFPIVDATTGLVIFTASKRIRHSGSAKAGVVAMDILITEILQEKELAYDWSSQMRSFLVTTSDNPESNAPGLLVLAQKAYQDRQISWSGIIEKEWLVSENSTKLGTIVIDLNDMESGYIDLPYKGVDSIWAYASITDKVHFVVIVPKSVVMDLPDKTSRAILESTREQLIYTAFAALIVIVFLTTAALYGSRTITRTLLKIATAAKRLSKGDFSVRLDVHTGDERDQVIQAFNELGPKLEDQVRIKNSLQLAREVQRSLLPIENPKLSGLDIAGTSIYCDETGGDYYDYYLKTDEPGVGRINMVVGDISGHGLASALLMTSARALLRQRTAQSGSIADIVTDVNRELTIDMAESGNFMTLFYLTIDFQGRKIQWVRAGHDPAIFYDPATDTFDELKGNGLALGAVKSWKYEENEKTDLAEGQIIFIGTDGIWETKNTRGQMFGKDPIFDIIRHNAKARAEDIVNAVISALNRFRGGLSPEDDVTLMVMKIGDK